jgi:hypothetical protein
LRYRGYPVLNPLIICATVLIGLSTVNVLAQQRATVVLVDNSLPEAPVPQSTQDFPIGQTAVAQQSASISGTVTDGNGAVVPRAQVSLNLKDGTLVQTMASGEDGNFSFSLASSGTYLVVVNAGGFASYNSAAFDIAPGQTYELPIISLNVGATSSTVTVRPTEVIAAEQMRAEEKQRVIGVFPNFYVSYIHDAAPLTSKQKFSLATRDTFDWTFLIGVSVIAGIEQANNNFAGYGQGTSGYAKRWAAQFANGRTEDFLSHAVFPSLLHQDPRYFYQGSGSTKSRLYHAVGNAFVARSDGGQRMPNYSYFLGALCSGAISNAYYPSADRGVGLVFTTAAIGLGGRAIIGVLQEFLGKQLTTNVSANGKP